MKICVFAYNFPHFKTQQGLVNLSFNFQKPDLIIAQNYKDLKIKNSKVKVTPKYSYLMHPIFLARKLKIDYIVEDHNNCVSILSKENFDIGIILGARILSKKIIDTFKIGIVNLHPGIIPFNRGLDNIKWAIKDNLPQCVTSHFIDERIDLGHIIKHEIINVDQNDTLVDIFVNVQSVEQRLLIESLESLKRNHKTWVPTSKGKYNKCMVKDEEESMLECFSNYKKNYNKIVEDFLTSI